MSVSVIIPAYPRTDEQFRWLCEAVNSVARNRHVLEIVVALDTPISATQHHQLHSLHHNIFTAIEGNPGRGAGAMRNLAARQARGEYLLPLDSDDLLLPDSVELLLEHAAPERVVYGDVEYFGDKLGIHRLPDYDLNNMLRMTGIAPVTALHTRAAWKAAGGWDESLSALEDVDYYLRLATIGVYGYHFDSVTLKYRKHVGSRQHALEQDTARLQQIRQYIHEKHKTLYNRGNMSQPCTTCPGQGGTGNGQMDRPAGIGPNTLTVRYDGNMQGNFVLQSWNVRTADGTPLQYVIQGRGTVLEIDARDRGQFESYHFQGMRQYRFLDSPAPTPPASVNIQEQLPSLPRLADMNAADSVAALAVINDAPDLFVLLAEEREGKNRKTVIEAIQGKLVELGSIDPTGVVDGSER